MRLKSFGEIMVEFDQEYKISIGGDTYNFCASAALHGLECEYTIKLGQDIFFDRYIENFAKYPVQTKIIESNINNGLYFIANDLDGERRFQYYRKGSAASTLSNSELGEDYFDDCDIFYNSGITAAIMPDLLKQKFQQARSLKIRTIYDINFRENLWSESEARSFLNSIIDLVDLLLISDDDLPILKGLEHSFVVHRKGADGCTVAKDGETLSVTAKKVEAVDTTGAGDAFAGSFVATYLETEDLQQSLDIATAWAARQVQLRGGLPSKSL